MQSKKEDLKKVNDYDSFIAMSLADLRHHTDCYVFNKNQVKIIQELFKKPLIITEENGIYHIKVMKG